MQRLLPLARLTALSALVLVGMAPAVAHAQTPPVVSFHGGPALAAPRVFLLFWGPFTSAEITAAQNYMKGYVGYLSNGSSPNGKQPTARQYGVWGAYYAGSAQDTATQPPDNSYATIRNKITAMQGASDPNNRVPPYDPTLLILVVEKGFSVCGAYHDYVTTGQYYGFIPYVNCGGGFTTEQWYESFAAHETIETATDPTIGGGWYFGSVAGQGEVNDYGGTTACGTNDTVTFPNGVVGLVPHIIDNIGQTCTCFTTLEQAGIAPVSWNSGTTVFVRGTDNAVKARSSSDGSTWAATVNLGGGTYDAPAATATPTTQDVFVRGGDAQLYQYHRTSSTGWTGPNGIGGQVFGPPSAVHHQGHLKVFANGYDGHPYVFDDGATGSTFTFSALPIPAGNVQAISPPRVFLQAGLDRIDILFTGNDGHVYRAAWGSEPSCPAFVDVGATFIAPSFESSRASNTGRADVFLASPNGDLYQNIISNGTPGGIIYQGGPIGGAPATADWGTANINLFGRLAGTNGGTLIMSTATNGVAFNGFNQVSPALTVTSSPVVLPPMSGNVMRVFVRRHSDGHLVHQSFNGTTPGLQQDLGIVVH
jgi:hypothetical protein